MANPTTNFGWVLPTNTDLVTDLPADFEIALQGVDTSLVDLKAAQPVKFWLKQVILIWILLGQLTQLVFLQHY